MSKPRKAFFHARPFSSRARRAQATCPEFLLAKSCPLTNKPSPIDGYEIDCKSEIAHDLPESPSPRRPLEKYVNSSLVDIKGNPHFPSSSSLLRVVLDYSTTRPGLLPLELYHWTTTTRPPPPLYHSAIRLENLLIGKYIVPRGHDCASFPLVHNPCHRDQHYRNWSCDRCMDTIAYQAR